MNFINLGGGGYRKDCTAGLDAGGIGRTVRLGLMQGVYERFLIKNLIRYRHQPYRSVCTGEGPSSSNTFSMVPA